MRSSWFPNTLKEMKRPLFFILFALLLPAHANATSALPTGLFVANALNAHPLPRVERVPSVDGWEHWFKLEQGLLTLRPDGRFIASFRYYRKHVKPRSAVTPGPLLNETYKGKFSVSGTRITLIADPTKKYKKVQPIIGTISGQRMSIPYIVAEGQSKHPLRLDLKREGNW
ncbi:MAG TPA: hypothetical protein VM939_12520 [Gemmatimonadaceae bacterium]|nr:hypothetical protein [Gemmatimonadaceae bacterium]